MNKLDKSTTLRSVGDNANFKARLPRPLRQPHRSNKSCVHPNDQAVACLASKHFHWQRKDRSSIPIAKRLGDQRDAVAIKANELQTTFACITRSLGTPGTPCPKAWCQTFCTFLQDTIVDQLIRQITVGHKPTGVDGLGMTANYTHTRPETQRNQIEAALRRWPKSLELVTPFLKGR